MSSRLTPAKDGDKYLTQLMNSSGSAVSTHKSIELTPANLSIKTDLTDVNDLFDDLQTNGYFNEEVIYYSTAIRYLKDNDPSLTESLEIATEYGYEAKNLNSELLATLHASQKKENTFFEDIAPELENLFNN